MDLGTCGNTDNPEVDLWESCLLPSMCQWPLSWKPPRPFQAACQGLRPSTFSSHSPERSDSSGESPVSNSAVASSKGECQLMGFSFNETVMRVWTYTCRTTADVTSEKVRSGYGMSQQYISHKQMPKLYTSHFLLYGLPLRTCKFIKAADEIDNWSEWTPRILRKNGKNYHWTHFVQVASNSTWLT